MHIHVISGNGEAKFWIKPEIELEKNYNYTQKQLKEIKTLIKGHYDEIIQSWEKHFES